MKNIFIIIIALVLSLLFSCSCAETADETELSLLAINVGKADALLLRSGETTYLIDTGSKKDRRDPDPYPCRPRRRLENSVGFRDRH